MKTITIILFASLVAGFVFTGCNEYKDNEDNNAALHQEILPKGRKSDLDTITRMSEGETHSVTNPPQ